MKRCPRSWTLLAACFALWLATDQAVSAQTARRHGSYNVAQLPSGPTGGPQQPVALPCPFPPLPERHQEYLDQLLDWWEYSSAKIKRYRCSFQRWEYDWVFGPKHTYNTYSKGTIKFSAPDKGLFKVEEVVQYKPPQQPGGKDEWAPADETHLEHWVCDGQSVVKFDYRRKQLIEHPLPPEMRGEAIADGPLPFLFGAKAETIKQRYWIRVITPRGVEQEYWLEVFPKKQEDAANFKKVQVIIDREEGLPKALVVYAPKYKPRRDESRTSYVFKDREFNWSILPEKLNLFHREFYKPATPRGWKRVVDDLRPSAAVQPASASMIRR